MKSHIKSAITIGIIIMGLLFAASAAASEVAQGKCLEFNVAAKTVKVQEYDINFSKEFKYGNPTSIESEFDVSTAKIGKAPEPGDILRISYKIEGNSKIALKIMNVSKQDLMKK
ncbi:MAG: hypothetical protein WA081_01130 [Desulfosalsimonadaceae bacterium]